MTDFRSGEPGGAVAGVGIDGVESGQPVWAEWPDDKLLDLRMSSLGVSIRGTELETSIRQLRAELRARGLRFRPHFWLAEEWFTPDGVPGIAIPFYLVHPRLARLEHAQMLEVEGGTPEWCMRILRHEAGHAIDNAYRLRRRRRRQELFGRSSQKYPECYTPRPYSRSYVLHLDMWYGQSHPDEDFAETFAVWLTPGSDWRQRYAGWPALKKLEYMDDLMNDIAAARPPVSTRRKVEPLERLDRTLREHYAEKRQRYGLDLVGFYDRELRRLFSNAPEHTGNLSAARFLRGMRRELLRTVARSTGLYQYTVSRVLDDIIERCRVLKLHLAEPPEKLRVEAAVLLAVQTMNYLQNGGHRIAL